MKTEELRGGQKAQRKREAEISIKTGQSAKPSEQENIIRSDEQNSFNDFYRIILRSVIHKL